jgi:hypothetical protein
VYKNCAEASRAKRPELLRYYACRIILICGGAGGGEDSDIEKKNKEQKTTQNQRRNNRATWNALCRMILCCFLIDVPKGDE